MSTTGWPVKDVTQRLYDNLQPVAAADNRMGWPLLAYIDAIGKMFQDGADLVQDGPNGEPGWSIILDVNRVPDNGLDWLGQLLGMKMYVGLTPAQKRQQIRDHASWQRGTAESIKAAIRLFLTGTQTVQIAERDTGPYHFTATINASEAPADTSLTSPLVTYVNTYAKPAGINWTLVVGTAPPATYGFIYNRGDTYDTMYSSFQTYANIH